MSRKDITISDDPFDSPMASPTVLPGSALRNTVRGSALAEHIFNDPAAWGGFDDDNEYQPDGHGPFDEVRMEEIAWLENEINISMQFTPSMLNFAALPDEEITLPNSPTRPRAVKETAGYDELHTPDPITAFPTYIHDPPGGLDAPRKDFIKALPGFESDDVTHLLNSDDFSAKLHVRLSHVHSVAEARPLKPSHILSPPSSQSSASSFSSSRSGCHPSSAASALSVAVDIISPVEVNSASTTLSFLEWHGIQANTPSASAGVTKAVQSSGSEAIPPSSEILPPQESIQMSTTQPDNRGTLNIGHRDTHSDTRKDVVTSDSSGTRDVGSGSAPLTPDHSVLLCSPKHQGHRKRRLVMCETPTNKKPTIHARSFPKPPPTIPLPDIPADAPSLHPKNKRPLSPWDTNQPKPSTRRLPIVPMKSASNFDVNTSSPIVYTPLPQPPHTSAHHPPMRSYSAPQTAIPPRTWARLENYGSPSILLPPSASSTSTIRSPPCPAGPRRRGNGNTTTPIKLVVSMENLRRDSESSPVVPVPRSVSAPRALPRPVHLTSE